MSIRIALQGFVGSFHQLAARHYFGPLHTPVACSTFEEVVGHVVRGTAERGLLAIENSIVGSLLQNHILLRQSPVRVTGEVYLRIRQHLLALPGQALTDLREVRSHPVALRQCADFLGQHPHWRLVETDDTGRSAQHIRDQGLMGVAAVAGEEAARQFGLEVLAADVHSAEHNYTRFLVLERAAEATPAPRPDKASLCFHLAETPGRVADVLACVAAHQLQLAMLQVSPLPEQPWRYCFHADVEFNDPTQLENLLRVLPPLTSQLRVLGVYCKGLTY